MDAHRAMSDILTIASGGDAGLHIISDKEMRLLRKRVATLEATNSKLLEALRWVYSANQSSGYIGYEAQLDLNMKALKKVEEALAEKGGE